MRRFFATALFFVGLAVMPGAGHADLIQSFDLSPVVPTVLDAMMMVATGTYEYFVQDGWGIIQLLIWGFLGFSIALGLIKMYFPKQILQFVGFSGGGEMWDGKATPKNMIEGILKPGLRAIIAVILLLQIKPVLMTNWILNPFLEFGSIYTRVVLGTMNEANIVNPEKVTCPADIVEKAWISEKSCEFLTQPVADLSHANNQVIRRGIQFMKQGLRGMLTLFSHNGGENLMNLLSGIVIIVTFAGCNLFMALLIIQAIFNLGIAIILYPFNVLVWVIKDDKDWFNLWPAFSNIVKALQDIIITMISCAFILCINVAVVKALFQWNSSVFVAAAGGTASSNIPTVANNAMGFGQHSVLIISAILTFYIMKRVFDVTQSQLKAYTGGMDGLYNTVKSDAKATVSIVKNLGKKVKGLFK